MLPPLELLAFNMLLDWLTLKLCSYSTASQLCYWYPLFSTAGQCNALHFTFTSLQCSNRCRDKNTSTASASYHSANTVKYEWSLTQHRIVLQYTRGVIMKGGSWTKNWSWQGWFPQFTVQASNHSATGDV